MDEALAILILEDRKTDMELTRRAVLKAFPKATFTHALDKDEFIHKLEWMQYDLVLADYHLPGYNGLEALLHLRQTKQYLPFIFVTGALDSEETAAKSILHGANGYVLKENLKALPEQITEALEWSNRTRKEQIDHVKMQRARQIKIQKLSGLLSQSPDFPDKDTALRLLTELSYG